VISGSGNGAAVVCNALLVQRGAPDALRGRAFAVLMSSNVAMLTLGMIVAGHFTDIVGPRWIWGAASIAAGVAGVVGLVLARAASGSPGLPERRPLHAGAVEPTQRA
jgi:MFS family permease